MRNRELESRLAARQANYFYLLHQHLRHIADATVKLTNKERVTIYRRDRHAFVRLDRYSLRESFATRGRSFYPDGEGCIAQAWDLGEYIIQDLPDPETQAEEYYAILWENQRIPRSTAENFIMKSRSLAAYRLDDPASGDPIAVVVFESMRSQAFGPQKLTTLREQARGLSHFIISYRALEPMPSLASDERL